MGLYSNSSEKIEFLSANIYRSQKMSNVKRHTTEQYILTIFKWIHLYIKV